MTLWQRYEMEKRKLRQREMQEENFKWDLEIAKVIARLRL